MGLNITCKEAHRLTSEGLDRELSLVERARMQMHFLACAGCRHFDDQMQLIRRAMRKLTIADAADKEHESQ